MNRKNSWGENKTSLLDKIIENQRLNVVNKHIKNGTKMLDLGCGYEGKILFKFKNKIASGIGIDLSVGKGDRKIKLLKGRVDRHLNIRTGSFDLITALAVIEHVDNPQKMLSESYRLLKRNGILILTTPSHHSKPLLELLAFNLNLISKDEILDHKRYYDLSTLKKDLVSAGFKNNKVLIKYFQIGLNIVAVAKK